MDTLSPVQSTGKLTVSFPSRRLSDCSEIVFESAVINVANLDVLERLTREPLYGATSPRNLWDWMSGESIRRLNVTCRLPLSMYQTLEKTHDEGPLGFTSRPVNWDMRDVACATWASVWPAICWLPKLRNLHIRLERVKDAKRDEDEERGEKALWSVVRERQAVGDCIMAVLAANLQARAREKLPHVDVLFHLPPLLPNMANPDTQFLAESPLTRFSLERRFRLRYFDNKYSLEVLEGSDGHEAEELGGDGA